MSSPASSPLRSRSSRYGLLRSTAPAWLAWIAGCNEPPAPVERSAAPTIARAAQPLRTREGRAAQLLALTRDLGARNLGARDLGARDLPLPPDAFDAGVSDAGNEPSSPPADAAAPELPPPPPSLPPPSQPPPGLPRDIVEQSALPIYGLAAGVVLTEAELWDRLAQSPAVCFGEYHDVPAHHYAEARALDALSARAESAARPFAVGFEMFQRPYQAPLSAFVASELGEEEFLAQTEYATRWGYDFALYRPLLEGARDRQLPALALNMQREITRKIGRTGLASLTEQELALLPELVLDDAEHRAFIFGLFGVLPEHAEEFGLENIYVAQTVWDETMADTSARWLSTAGSEARLLDFAGAVHCHPSAIPRRITRRTGEPTLSVHAVFESELTEGTFSPEGYDVLVVLDD